MRRPPPAAVSAILAALLTALTLSSCSAESLAERAVERSVENASGEGAEVDFDADSGEVSVESDEGSFSSGGSLPDDFPRDDIPLLEGEVIQAASSSQEGSAGFVVIVQVEAGVEEAVEEAGRLLLDAGFTPDGELGGIEGSALKALRKAPYSVLLTAYDAEGAAAVNYVISVE